MKRIETWVKENGSRIFNSVIASLLIITLILIVDMRDTIKYKQPHVDQYQNYRLDEIQTQIKRHKEFQRKQREINTYVAREISIICTKINRGEYDEE